MSNRMDGWMDGHGSRDSDRPENACRRMQVQSDAYTTLVSLVSLLHPDTTSRPSKWRCEAVQPVSLALQRVSAPSHFAGEAPTDRITTKGNADGRTFLSVPLFSLLFSLLFFDSYLPYLSLCLVFSLFSILFLVLSLLFYFFHLSANRSAPPSRSCPDPVWRPSSRPISTALYSPQTHPYRIGPAHSLNTPFSLFLSTQVFNSSLQLKSSTQVLNSSLLTSRRLFTSSSLTSSLYSVSLSLHADSSLYIIHRSIHLAPHLSITIQPSDSVFSRCSYPVRSSL